MIEPFSDPAREIPQAGGATLFPGFFDPVGQLFGCYHRPAGIALGAVLLCPAFGHEYVRSHRAFRHLAERLARAGRSVLRFDLYGSGDSAGDDLEATFDRFQDDVGEALAALRRHSGQARPVILGRRLGATLAVLHGATQGEVDDLVLWDPVVSGRTYLDELEAAHLEFVRSPRGRYLGAMEESGESSTDRGFTERMGQRISTAMMDAIAAVDLLRIERAPASRVLLVETREHPGPGALAVRLEELGVEVDRRKIPDPQGWTIDDPLQQVVPNPVLAEIEEWIRGRSTR